MSQAATSTEIGPASGRATPRPCNGNGNGVCTSAGDGNDIEELRCPVSGNAGPSTSCPAGRQHSKKPSADIETMQEIDPILLRVSLEDRVRYLKDFIGFSVRDVDAMRVAAPVVSGIINDTVERLYANLFEFDITKKVFMERNEGFDGDMPERLEDLRLDGPQLTYRKVFMRTWCRRVLTTDYSSGKVWAYMDKVGVMHTGAKAFKHRAGVPPLHVPYRDCALSLGWVQNVLNTAILSTPDDQLDMPSKIAAISAYTKVLWIQNDLFARHYIPNE